MDPPNKTVRIVRMPLPFRRESIRFQESITLELRSRMTARVGERMERRNMLFVRHGTKTTPLTSSPPNEGFDDFQHLKAEVIVTHADILKNRVALVEEMLQQTIEDMWKPMMAHLYKTISEGANSVGNVVRGGTPPSVFRSMLEMIPFHVDEDGRVSMPEIHMGSDPATFLAALEAQPPEFHHETTALQYRKVNEAIELDRKRRSNYRHRRIDG